MLKKSSRQSVSPLAPEVIVKTNALSKKRRFSSPLIKVVAVLTASLTLACGLPATANAAPAPTTFLCATGSYTVSWSGVVASGVSCSGAVTIDASARSIGDYAFYDNAGLTSITIPSGVTRIGEGAFWKARDLTDISIPSSVTSILSYAFYNMASLTTITVDNANATYSSNDGVLFNKLQTDLLVYPGGKIANPYVIPGSVTNISNYAFAASRFLTTVSIPTGVTSIGTNAFEDSTSLASITIPLLVTSIGVNAFSRTTALTSYKYCGSASLTDTGLHGTPTPCTTVPDAPTIGTATSTGTTTATVAFTAPGSNGGSTILTYVATSSPGSITVTLTQAGSGTISITGLSATTSYTFTIIAHNALGNSVASGASNSMTTGTPVLSAPLTVTVTGLNAAQIQVAFTAPASNGGSLITSYTIISVPAKVTATLYQAGAGSVIFSGLEGGTNYTFSVIAHTALADSPETISSSGVIMPAYIPIPQMMPMAAPQLTSNGESLVCSIGGYSQSPSASIFSLFVGGNYISTNFSAGGAFLPDWIIDWATPGTISRTATLQDAIWKIDPSWAGKKVSCRTVGYANNAIGITDSKALRL